MIILDLLQVSKQDQAIQVDEATLQWTPENMISSVLQKPLTKLGENDDKLDGDDEYRKQNSGHRSQNSQAENNGNKDVKDTYKVRI
jgi:hypothetical protein